VVGFELGWVGWDGGGREVVMEDSMRVGGW